MVNGFDVLNMKAQEAEKAKHPDPAPAPAPGQDTCAMCGAMAQHADPEKVKAFMDNNPFAAK